jgi:4-aminobutyrate--pyruvate transaminase
MADDIAPSLPNSLSARDIAYHMHPQTNLAAHLTVGPHTIARGEGAYVWDVDGNRYLEGMSGLWCTALGFSEERLIAAAEKQLRTLPYYQSFGHRSVEPATELAEALIAMAPGNLAKAFFANSGSEANDSAIKMVWYYNNALGRPEKKKLIARDRGYHGVGIISGSLTGLPNIHRSFDLPIAGVHHTRCAHWWRERELGETEEAFSARCAAELDALIEAEGPETVAAFIAEPVMGAGGVMMPPRGYFAAIQKVLKKHDVLLIADEVITGFGRTGAMWGSETFGLQPDILTCAKALSSAYQPISAVLCTDAVFAPIARHSGEIGTFGHGFTYSGHPVACAVALEAVRIYQERDLAGRAAALGQKLAHGLAALASHPLVGEARSVGLLGAVELSSTKDVSGCFPKELTVPTRVANAVKERGVFLRAVNDSVAICPPLIINEADLDVLLSALKGGLDAVAAELSL